MKLQLALDRLTRGECFRILEETKEAIDWIEVGTGVIKEYGMTIVREIRELYPNHTIVADMKTCDAGKHEAKQAFEAGADIVTVMAFSANQTITDTLAVAQRYQKSIMIDLLGVTEQKRLIELEQLGVKLVSLHFGKDMQQEGELSTDLFSLVKADASFEVSVAGGINEHSLPSMVNQKPDIIIVGSAITGAEHPQEAALKLKGMMKE
ncbi:3-hexulose-6-phosphate synthase [Desertibacillus haloalkaliphilus]|uniref:3-hexulose-6-phosphate synthase n=1 Tax=Desertibacillus haloalkaliphilus TaxID=1328930 RepID=UPI001C2637C6|nr:3-hexulose-6-phosphate synthase [Desertibacillus haloalkaliphilus]MBU8906683.1 orotidine 5'-phosphate decarboxylase [Desertibacillus haloalkaliphilus]